MSACDILGTIAAVAVSIAAVVLVLYPLADWRGWHWLDPYRGATSRRLIYGAGVIGVIVFAAVNFVDCALG